MTASVVYPGYLIPSGGSLEARGLPCLPRLRTSGTAIIVEIGRELALSRHFSQSS